MTTHVYLSTDPGAPAHPSTTRGSMVALLRACLVTGYSAGDTVTAAAGWEEPYTEANNKACFRAKTGARQFFQIDDTCDVANVAMIHAFESMSDAETGEGQWDASVIYFGKQYNNTVSTTWMVIADEKTCYLFLTGSSLKYSFPLGFGEFYSFVDDTPYNSFVAGHYNSSYMSADQNNPLVRANSATAVDGAGKVHKDIRNLSSSNFGVLKIGQGKNIIGEISATGYSSAIDGCGWPVLPILIAATGDVSASLGVPVLGKLRGIYQPMAHIVSSTRTSMTIDDRTFWGFLTDGNGVGYGQLLVDAGDWE